MTELEEKIQKAAQAYYTNGSSELSDAEFDSLVERLRLENPESPLLQKTGWGYSVESDSTPGMKYPHKYGTAGSLTKARRWEEIDSKLKNKLVDVSLKIDGISVVIYYKNGKLYQALTRGDGNIGIDITDKINLIKSVSSDIDSQFTGAVRGEIVMSFKNFDKFKAVHPEAKNPRNAVAGLINRKEITEDISLLDVVVYSVVGCENDYASQKFNSIWNVRSCLNSWFRHLVPKTEIYINKSAVTEGFMRIKDRWADIWPSDGLVLTYPELKIDVDNIMQQSQAFKFKSEIAQTGVLEVEWNMSKTGYSVPKIKVKPVFLSGTTVQYCTGYNAKYIKDNNIAVGSIVEIEKHGEIIPTINKVIAASGTAELPKFCPHCQTELQWDGVHLKCMNPQCSNSNTKDTLIWTGILAPVDMLGDSLKQSFFTEIYGEVPTIEILMYDRTNAYSNATEGTQAYRMRKMLDSLFSNDTIELVNAIKALNIPRFGDVNASKLAEYPDEVHELFQIACDGSCADGMKALKLFNTLTAYIGSANSMALQNNMDKIARLRFIEKRINWSVAKKHTSVFGKVAITGKLSVKRADFEKELLSAGFTPTDIGKDTKFLITDDPNSSSSKNKKADKWNIPKIMEQEFRERYLADDK